ncbi:ribulose-phosphate 3-epimerase [Candidatus Acetothermia bacterium]|nr:ribulose-phosphate 3-epimerase [Candidatus Acetothermia bacterium]MBI3643021.1 ribulose-phosphate 3-epimerase [Candidatus Acetothermia bacterium]
MKKLSTQINKKIEIAPSILSADFTRLGEQLAEAERCGANRIHIDVMDGHFVPPVTMGPVIVEACRKVTHLPLEAHLMTEKPERLFLDFIRAGASIVIVHQEAVTHLHRLIHQVKDSGSQAGVALNPATPIQTLEHVLEELDLVLIMTVNPGYSAQAFIRSMLPKIRALSTMIEERKLAVDIEVDGGISPETASLVVQEGANVLVAGSAIFGSKAGIPAAMKMLQESALRRGS